MPQASESTSETAPRAPYPGEQAPPKLAGESLSEYAALRQKIDAFTTAVTSKRNPDMKCRAGCAACCQVELTVSEVEAAAIFSYLRELPAHVRAALAKARTPLSAAAAQQAHVSPRCAMLKDDDTCAIYPVRPLVCRSQGLPLLYARELVPESAQLGLSADGRALTCCPLNFSNPARPPARDEILDADRVDVLLSLVNRRFAAATSTSAESRYPLTDLLNISSENL